jgi:hypothetical protein
VKKGLFYFLKNDPILAHFPGNRISGCSLEGTFANGKMKFVFEERQFSISERLSAN